jgi:phosphotransferase system IIB component
MAGVDLRNIGTTALFAPRLKRATGRLSDGRAVALYIDTNQASSGGTDVTGVAKIYLYLSTDSTRTAFTAAVALTPAVAPASATRYAVASMAVGTDNSVWVAWQGVDNGLYLTKWTYSAGIFTFVATQTVVAADALITNKYRVLDIDVAGTSNPVIAAYEAIATSGQGAFMRVYIRRNDNTTWIKAWEVQTFTTEFIRADSEDIAVSWHLDGIVSNVGKFLIYYAKPYVNGDQGDTVREISYNTSTGAALSATVLGTWGTSFHVNQASGTRRAWIYKLTSGGLGMWLWCGIIGNAVPQFFASKLTTGLYGAPTITRVGSTPTISTTNFFKVDASSNSRNAVATDYADNRLIFGFASYGVVQPRVFREIMFRWNLITDYGIAQFVDSTPRPLDGNYYVLGGPITLYGGANNRMTNGDNTYNFVTSYGGAGNNVSAFAEDARRVRFISEDVYDAPTLRSPKSATVATNRPNFQVVVNPLAPYTNLYGKVDIQLASDSGFTTNLRTCTQPDSAFQYFGSVDTLLGPGKLVQVDGSLLSAVLFTGGWYWRARVISDKGKVGAWSSPETFNVLHAPILTPRTPKPGILQGYGTGDVTFSWTFSDSEPADSQSAYYLKVTRTDTGVLIVDTNWVTSSVKSVVQNFASSLKEIPLSWQVAAKDPDGTAGPFADGGTFILGDVPTVAITTPPIGATTLNLNPTFEVDATNWTPTGGTFARDTTQFQTGVASGKLTPDGVTAAPQVESDKVTVTTFGTFPVSAWVRTPTTWAGGVFLKVNWYTSGNVFISSSTVSTIASLTGATWTLISGTATAPATAVKASVVVSIAGTPAAINVLNIDEARFKNTVVTTALPTVAWTYSGGGGRAQRAFRVIVTNLTNGSVVADTLWQFSTSTSYTFTDQILQNTTPYSFQVQVQDIAGLSSTATSWATTQWVIPAQPSPVTAIQDGFKTTINWDQTDIDVDFVSWRVWRRYQRPALAEMDFDASATTWELIYETTTTTTAQYLDYLAPLNRSADYAVTQLVDRFGSLIDAPVSSFVTVTCVGDRYYFVPEVVVGTIASFQASFVTADAFTDEIEQETIHVLGRGRQVQVGDTLGYTGSLTIKLRNAAAARGDREFLEYLSSEAGGNVYLRSPFGDVLLVKLGNISMSRMAGVGLGDLGDLTIPYSQVIDDSMPVTRTS